MLTVRGCKTCCIFFQKNLQNGEPNATLNTSDPSKFRHLRDKLQQWNSDLKKRRNSQVFFKKKWGNNIAPLSNINTAKRVPQIWYLTCYPFKSIKCEARYLSPLL